MGWVLQSSHGFAGCGELLSAMPLDSNAPLLIYNKRLDLGLIYCRLMKTAGNAEGFVFIDVECLGALGRVMHGRGE